MTLEMASGSKHSPSGAVPESIRPPRARRLDPAELGARWWPRAEAIGEPRYLVRTACAVVATMTLGLCFELAFASRLEHTSAQTRAFNRLRVELAQGVAPIGPLDDRGRLLALGTPVALIEIPTIGVRQVALEGTTSGVLTAGPGHQRNTVLPGQPGVSVIDGRAAAYGGPFGGLHRLHKGDRITVTTGIGTSTFHVIDLRRARDPIPPPSPSGGRLTLVTATGAPFFPGGVLRVDADLVSPVQAGSEAGMTSLPHAETAMAGDPSTLWELVFLVQALILVVAGAVWSWRRWGRAQTWIVFFPLMTFVGYSISDQVARLLPNLL